MAIAAVLQTISKVTVRVLAGTASLAISSLTNSLLMAVVLIRFVLMTLLRSLSSVVEFVGETTINVISFVRDTVFSVLTFVVQTITSTILFVLNQFVSIWRLVVTLVTVALGETCFLTKTAIKRIVDALKDVILSLQAFATGVPGMVKVLKAQSVDVKKGVDVKSIIKQAVESFKGTLMYILKGDENKITDGLIPNVFIEVFKSLPLTFDLAKLILLGTWDISKETLSVAFSSLKELTSLKGIKLGCIGKVSKG